MSFTVIRMNALCNLISQHTSSVQCKQILCGQYGQDQKAQNGSEFFSASCSVTLVEDADLKVLVDCCSVYEKDKLIQALSAANVSPPEITHLIITHWHSDHCGNIALFSNSTLITPENRGVFISSNISTRVFPGHSALDLVVRVEQHCSAKNQKRVVVIAGDLFECADDWLEEEKWKLSRLTCFRLRSRLTATAMLSLPNDYIKVYSMLPGCQAIARALCWKEADVIVPGHGPAFLSTGSVLPLQNPLPSFDNKEGKATITKLLQFPSQSRTSNEKSKLYSVFLVRSENFVVLVNTGDRQQKLDLLSALDKRGIQLDQVTHVVISSMGAEFCANLCLFSNATVFMYNDISITGSFYAPFRPPAMSITSDVFVWKSFSPVDQGQLSVVVNNGKLAGKVAVITDDVDEFLPKYLDLDAMGVEVYLTSQLA